MGFSIVSFRSVFIILLMALVSASFSSLDAFGEKPDFSKKKKAAEEPIPQEIPDPNVPASSNDASSANGDEAVSGSEDAPGGDVSNEVVPTASLSDDEFFELQQQYEGLIAQKQFAKALEVLKNIPKGIYTKRLKAQRKALDMFERVDALKETQSSEFQNEEELDDDTRKTVKRLYREAQLAYFNGDQDTARDLLIQVLYLHRRNYRARKFLDIGLGLPLGSYKVENIQEKYLDQSYYNFAGGSAMESIKFLKVLAVIDPEDALVYTRLGSSYYRTGQLKQALRSWNAALFLNPNDKDLKVYVDGLKKLIAEQDAERLKRAQSKKKDVKKKDDKPMRLLSTFRSKEAAFEFANKSKSYGLTPVVEENEQGLWEVKVPDTSNEGEQTEKGK